MQALGEVIGCYTNAKTGRHTEVFHQKNLILYQGADIMAGLLAGNISFAPSHMYFQYENTSGALSSFPTPGREDGRDFFTTIDGITPVQDWLRVPIITTPRISAIHAAGQENLFTGNAATFTGSSAASDTLVGESPAHNYFAASGANGPSKVFALALVAAVNPNTNRDDRVFSRLTLSSPMEVISGHHLTFFWTIKFN